MQASPQPAVWFRLPAQQAQQVTGPPTQRYNDSVKTLQTDIAAMERFARGDFRDGEKPRWDQRIPQIERLKDDQGHLITTHESENATVYPAKWRMRVLGGSTQVVRCAVKVKPTWALPYTLSCCAAACL